MYYAKLGSAPATVILCLHNSSAFSMRTLASALLLSCCFWASLAQSYDEEEQRRGAWNDPIQFITKAKDQCSMIITGQEDLTKLRISCQSRARSYWCEYQGRPHLCRPYNSNPRHFFTQIMWDLRKLRNACQGRTVLKNFMCSKATHEAQMVFASSSSSYDVPRDELVQPDARQVGTDYPKSDQARPEPIRPIKPSRPRPERPGQPRPSQRKPGLKPGTAPTPIPTPTTPATISKAKKLAQKHCWPSLQSACSYVIGWFTNNIDQSG
uniref:Fibroblast growth factor binding protein 2a n=1 Tax=Astyanax mexicanus TaxID=7994 RepID=A0A8B9HJW8_ASTMX